MVNVGPGFGALVVTAPGNLLGEEIEISPVETPELRQHVYVLRRTLPRGTAFAAVFPSLRAGAHLLWSPQGEPVMTVGVLAGMVEEVIWPPSGAAAPATTTTPKEGH